jgi:NADH-quinone oxidoreductase subunit J
MLNITKKEKDETVMDISAELFYLFSIVLLFSAFRVVTTRNQVHAALYLVLAFFQAAALWMLLKAEFLSIVLVLVYVGAVMVLFLFVVMMLDIDTVKVRVGFWKRFPLAAVLGILIVAEISLIVFNTFGNVMQPANSAPMLDGNALSNTQVLGILLYSHYLYAVEVAAAILTVAVVAAIALTLRDRKDSKHVNPKMQVRVTAKDRLRIIKMDGSQREVDVVEPIEKIEDQK